MDGLVHDTIVGSTFKVGLLPSWEVVWFRVVSVFIEMGIIDGVNTVVASRLWYNWSGFSLLVMSYKIQGMSLVELICLVGGGVNGKGSLLPVNSGVGLSKPGESKDDILLSAIHYIEENFMEYSSNVNIECGGETHVTSFVWGGVSISYWDRGFEASLGELVLLYNVPVYIQDLGSEVDEDTGINIF